jgi:hypothetical protein
MKAIAPTLLLLLAACGPGSPPAPSAPNASSGKVSVISKGDAFTSKDYLIPGQVSLLYFYADW